jgi:hypothetical protein
VATRPQNGRWLQRFGFALGLVAAAAGLLAARVPAEPPGLGLDLTVVPAAPKTLTLRPPGPLLTAPGMQAGGKGAGGSVTVLNPTAGTERVRVRALPSSRAVDRALMVELTAAGRPIYRGPLGGLRNPPGEPIVLQTGDGVAVRLHVWLPAGTRGWRGHIEDIDLAFDSVPAEAR